MSTLCIYHRSCLDGIGAAWAFSKTFDNESPEYYAAQYSESPPDVAGKHVYIVDFSYKREILIEMVRSAASITVIDHHKTAEADLSEPIDGLKTVFDMSQSGAVLTWKYFNDGNVPASLKYIQDRDLWRFELSGTKEFNSALFSYDTSNLGEMFSILDDCYGANRTPELIREGHTLMRDHDYRVTGAAKGAYRGILAGFDVPYVNSSPDLSSDLGHLLGEDEPFAVIYWDTKTKTIYSLRSSEDGEDVSEIAKRYGGGGHKHAAGFSVLRERGVVVL